MKSAKLLGEFTGYCLDHPEQRFWQALRNWSEARSITYYALGDIDGFDTYHWEGRGSYEQDATQVPPEAEAQTADSIGLEASDQACPD